jgi:AcrR family transcriptional regulator
VSDGPTQGAHPEQGGVSAPAALEVVGADGLAGLSMRKLAARLGIQVSSPRSHGKTRDDLLHEINIQIMERRRRSRSALRRLACDAPAASRPARTRAGHTAPARAGHRCPSDHGRRRKRDALSGAVVLPSEWHHLADRHTVCPPARPHTAGHWRGPPRQRPDPRSRPHERRGLARLPCGNFAHNEGLVASNGATGRRAPWGLTAPAITRIL